MRDPTQIAIIDALASECDAAAQAGDAEQLRRLHAFILQTATNYVRLRLTAIEARNAGTVIDDAKADEAERIAADIVARVKR